MIPRTDARFADAEEIETPARRRKGVETCVLVAENDSDAAFRFARALTQMGMRAVVSPTGREAIDRLSKLEQPIALACVDVGLSDVSGPDVVAEAHRVRPDMPVLLVSGSIFDVLGADGVVLCRPFTSEQFRAAFDAAMLREQEALAEVPAESAELAVIGA